MNFKPSTVRRWLGAAALCACAAAAQAQSKPAAAPRNFYFVFAGGITYGGDKLVEANYTNGDTATVRAGGLAYGAIGVAWQPAATPFAVQTTVGYHVDRVNASNGEIVFSRVPVEVLGYYTGVPNWRFGGGARLVNAPELDVEIDGNKSNVQYKNAIGFVVEAGYQLGTSAWIGLRLTKEDYQAESVNGFAVSGAPKDSGDSIGLNFAFLF